MHLPWTSVKARQRFEFMPLRIDDNLTIPLFAVVTPCSSEPSFTGWRDGPVTRRRACHPSREHAHGSRAWAGGGTGCQHTINARAAHRGTRSGSRGVAVVAARYSPTPGLVRN